MIAPLHNFQIGFYENTTHVGITKPRFDNRVTPFLNHAISEIFKQWEANAPAMSAGLKEPDIARVNIPNTLFPHVVSVLRRYDNNHPANHLIVFYKHEKVGVITAAEPKTFIVCPTCHKTLRQTEENKWECKEHGIVEPKEIIF